MAGSRCSHDVMRYLSLSQFCFPLGWQHSQAGSPFVITNMVSSGSSLIPYQLSNPLEIFQEKSQGIYLLTSWIKSPIPTSIWSGWRPQGPHHSGAVAWFRQGGELWQTLFKELRIQWRTQQIESLPLVERSSWRHRDETSQQINNQGHFGEWQCKKEVKEWWAPMGVGEALQIGSQGRLLWGGDNWPESIPGSENHFSKCWEVGIRWPVQGSESLAILIWTRGRGAYGQTEEIGQDREWGSIGHGEQFYCQ